MVRLDQVADYQHGSEIGSLLIAEDEDVEQV